MQKPLEDYEKMQPVAMERIRRAFQKDRLAHAYLFEGAAGSGIEDMTRFFVQLLLCQNPSDSVPCGHCRDCRLYLSGNHPNAAKLEPDGQYIKIDQIRELIYRMNKTGFSEGRKVYVIRQADRMNASSANALLKFLEEPEADVTAILLTDRLHAMMDTIQSRCQLITFRQLPREQLIRELAGQGVTESMAATVSMLTQSKEEAKALAEEEQFGQARKTVVKLVEVLNANVHEALLLLQTDWIPLFKEKEEAERGLDMLLFAYRDIASVKAGLEEMLTYPDMKETWKQIALQRSFAVLSEQLQAILTAKQQLSRNMNRTLMMEQLVLNLQEG
ncbi:DNA polymerase III subunit delta' [Planococcus lenghuensis]|uniref:DNA polymerase III subunit delta' n=1 Tax=Planococcus lenghuensis TaxID=2213202 RepID=A0A1Q2KU48_9BACL|nr:DNA polymerase III subunit delta' [Planococcus lenghuensis]AQQ51701.1 DNA polymerase III subunit delta' [Planococcus lenghuensis]